MNKEHPITPPPELVQQWINEEDGLTAGHIATQAAQWGADQELEACVEWASCFNYDDCRYDEVLRDIRRPKPPSLKEQALEVVTGLEKRWDLQCDLTLLRRALEALPE